MAAIHLHKQPTAATMAPPVGLFVFRNVIPSPLRVRLLTWLAQQHFTSIPNQIETKENAARKVTHFGFRYDYESRRVDCPAEPMPELMHQLRLLIVDGDETLAKYFNQLIVNVYQAGEGISPHIDALGFGGIIACFTLTSEQGRDMLFTHPDGIQQHVVHTDDCSLYVMTGDARYKWKHSMPNAASKSLSYSFTFRHVLEVKKQTVK